MQTVIKFLADGAVIPIVLIAIYALLFKIPKGNRFDAYCRILMAGLTAYLCAKLLGSIYQPSLERPFETMGVDPGASFLNNPGFPSDHALFTAFLTIAVWFETRKKGLAITMLVLTLLVCVGRVLALVHTPLDVVGGLAVAMVGSFWFLERKSVLGSASRRNVKKTV
jgi:membrane-associated phospholipid phosphatase